MAADQAHRTRSELSPEQRARVEAARAQRDTAEFRADEARARESLDHEYRETGTIATTGDGTTVADLLAFRRFAMSLRGERERQGLSLTDMADRSQIDTGTLSELENGQRCNPTINTLSRYARALGKHLILRLED